MLAGEFQLSAGYLSAYGPALDSLILVSIRIGVNTVCGQLSLIRACTPVFFTNSVFRISARCNLMFNDTDIQSFAEKMKIVLFCLYLRTYWATYPSTHI